MKNIINKTNALIAAAIVAIVLLIAVNIHPNKPVTVETENLGSRDTTNFNVGTTSTVSVGGTSAQIIATSSGRMYAVIGNYSGNNCWLSMNRDNAAAVNQGVPLAASTTVTITLATNPYNGAVRAICTNTSSLSVYESTGRLITQ